MIPELLTIDPANVPDDKFANAQNACQRLAQEESGDRDKYLKPLQEWLKTAFEVRSLEPPWYVTMERPELHNRSIPYNAA